MTALVIWTGCWLHRAPLDGRQHCQIAIEMNTRQAIDLERRAAKDHQKTITEG